MPASIEEVDFTTPRGLDREVFLSLVTGRYLRDHHNVIICGATGLGKTFLACALALDVEDFDAEIDVFFGKERERHILNTSGVVHYGPGIPHLGDEIRVVNQPFLHIMWVVGPEMDHYYRAAPVDKMQFGDEWSGDVMTTPGADDYVPPTPIDEWVWPYPDEEK